MGKRLLRLLRKYAFIADGLRKTIVFLQNHQEIIQALQDMSFMEIIICILYGGYLVYQWKTLLSEYFPRIYFIVRKVGTLMLSDGWAI